MGLYVIALYGGQWGAVPAGFINDSMGWPWVLFFCAILNAIGFATCFFFMEETMYVRDRPAEVAIGSAVTAAGGSAGDHVTREKKGADAETGLAQDVSHGKIYPVRTYWQKLSPFVPLHGRPNYFWKRVVSPIRLWRFPGILFAGFIYGCYLCWFAQVNAVVSIFFGGPPYSWAADVSSTLRSLSSLSFQTNGSVQVFGVTLTNLIRGDTGRGTDLSSRVDRHLPCRVLRW